MAQARDHNTGKKFKTTLRELKPEDREEFNTYLRDFNAKIGQMETPMAERFRRAYQGGNPLESTDLFWLIQVLDALP